MIVSTLLIQFYGWTGFDPIASIFIAILITASVIPLILDTGRILCLDVANRHTDIQSALDEVGSLLHFRRRQLLNILPAADCGRASVIFLAQVLA